MSEIKEVDQDNVKHEHKIRELGMVLSGVEINMVIKMLAFMMAQAITKCVKPERIGHGVTGAHLALADAFEHFSNEDYDEENEM